MLGVYREAYTILTSQVMGHQTYAIRQVTRLHFADRVTHAPIKIYLELVRCCVVVLAMFGCYVTE